MTLDSVFPLLNIYYNFSFLFSHFLPKRTNCMCVCAHVHTLTHTYIYIYYIIYLFHSPMQSSCHYCPATSRYGPYLVPLKAYSCTYVVTWHV
ncbi:hypothetical protein Hanom_Chr11g00981701 [Helianthus anomalus]